MHWRRPEIRIGVLVFAAILGLQALWLITTEALRPNVSHFPMNTEVSGVRRFAAAAAAHIGAIRGDLWADYAAILLANLPPEPEGDSAGSPTVKGRAVALTAAKLEPAHSRNWLLLALVESRLNRPADDVLGLLKMSYYTGPNDTAIMPLRLEIATRSAAIADPELQDFVGRDIRTMVVRRPDLKPALIAAYGKASSEGKRFIEAKVNDLDRDLSETIRRAAR
jgi:hypothetical protein